MNEKQLKPILTQLAEDGVPAEASVWPALQARLARGGAPGPAAKGTLMLKPVTAARALGAATLTIILLAAALLVTPQGRAFAQSLWQFFSLAPAASFAVAPAPTPAAGEPTAAAPSVNAAECGADLACQLASAESLVGFTPHLPSGDFAGLTLEAVQAAGGILRLSYTAAGGGGLVLSQSQGDLTASRWDQVAPEAVHAVQVGAHPGEYVEGTFVVPAGETTAMWNSDAPVIRLRWQQAGLVFEIAKLGDPEHLEHLDQAALIALAQTIQ